MPAQALARADVRARVVTSAPPAHGRFARSHDAVLGTRAELPAWLLHGTPYAGEQKKRLRIMKEEREERARRAAAKAKAKAARQSALRRSPRLQKKQKQEHLQVQLNIQFRKTQQKFKVG